MVAEREPDVTVSQHFDPTTLGIRAYSLLLLRMPSDAVPSSLRCVWPSSAQQELGCLHEPSSSVLQTPTTEAAPLGEFASRFVTRESFKEPRLFFALSIFLQATQNASGVSHVKLPFSTPPLRTLQIISDRLHPRLPLSCRRSRCGSGSGLSRLEFLSFAKPRFAKFGRRDS
jgi:hypothetical protein